MQTHFSIAQLAQDDIAEADSILRDCVHCGMCLATCPTYLLLGDERDSPRGRIYLIKNMLEEGERAFSETVTHLDRCLTCLACETTCPSGVDYRHLLDIGREQIAQGFKRPFWDRVKRRFLAFILPRPDILRVVFMLGRVLFFLKPIMPWLEKIPASLHRRRKMHELLPLVQPKGRKVLLLMGCAQQILRPAINEAAIELLHSLGIEVIPSQSHCCGAISHHLGYAEEAKSQAQKLLTLFRQSGAQAIITTSSGCASVMREYQKWLPNEAVASVQEISIYLQSFVAEWAQQPLSNVRVAYHAPCSLRNGLKIPDLPKELLRKAGYQLLDMPEQHLCCGSAGTYNLLEPELAEKLQMRKKELLMQMDVEVFASSNIGCLEQILGKPGFHYIELLNWAKNGRKPEGC